MAVNAIDLINRQLTENARNDVVYNNSIGLGKEQTDYAGQLPQALLHGRLNPYTGEGMTYNTGGYYGYNNDPSGVNNRVYTQDDLNNRMSGVDANALYYANVAPLAEREALNRIMNTAEAYAGYQRQENLKDFAQQQLRDQIYGEALAQMLEESPEGQSLLERIKTRPGARQRNVTGSANPSFNRYGARPEYEAPATEPLW